MSLLKLFAVFGILDWAVCSRLPARGDIWVLAHLFECILVAAWGATASGHVLSSLVNASGYLSLQVVVFCAIHVAYRLSPLHPLYAFPGPFFSKISNLPSLLRVARGKRFQEMVDLHQQYGTFVRTGPNNLSINDHAPVDQVYASATAWEKSSAYKLGLADGAGLFFMTSRDEHHPRRRHYWAPYFSQKSLSAYTPYIEARSDVFLEQLGRQMKSLGHVDLSDALHLWSHDITGDFIFGDSYTTNYLRDGDRNNVVPTSRGFIEIFESLGESTTLFHLFWKLPPTKAIRITEAESVESIERRKQLGSGRTNIDLMHYLMNEENRDIPALTDADLIQETSVALAAGTNAISVAVAFSLFHLISNPDKLQRLVQELREALPDHDGTGSISSEVLINLPYLSAVIEESMRLGAPLGTFARVAPEGGAVLAGQFVPGGTIVSVPAWAQNIDEKNFSPHPQSFLPERWLPGGLGPGSYANKNAVMSFSHGPFGCIGKQLAYQELRLMVVKTVLHYKLSFGPEFDPRKFLDGVENRRVTDFTVPLIVTIEPRSE